MREGERGEGRKEGVREGERGEGGREREGGERESSETQMHSHTHIQQVDMYTHTYILYYCVPYYYVLYTHPERDQCYNESRQSVPDASSGPGQ